MKCKIRLKVIAGTALLLGLVILGLVLEDKTETYHPLSYLSVAIPWLRCDDSQRTPVVASGNVQPGDKIVVVPSLEEEDVSWVADELPE